MSDDLEPVVALDHVAHDAEIAHRDRRHLGVEHARRARAQACSSAMSTAAPSASPHASGKGALQVLHLGQDVAHVLAVPAALAGAAERPLGRQRQARLGDDVGELGEPGVAAGRPSAGPRPAATRVLVDRVALEQLGEIGPAARPARPSMRAPRFVGAVAQAHHPVGRMLAGGSAPPSPPCRRCRRARRRSSARSARQSSLSKVASSEVAQHRDREVAARQLDQREVAEVALVAQEGELVFVVRRAPSSASSSPARVSTARAWPTRSSAMFVRAMSSSRIGAWPHHSARRWREDQAGVADAQQVLHRRLAG